MTIQKRRSSFSASTTSSLAKMNALANVTQPKKRAPLGDVTNQKNVSGHLASKNSVASSTLVPCTTKVAKKKEPIAGISNVKNAESEKSLPPTLTAVKNAEKSIPPKASEITSSEDVFNLKKEDRGPSIPVANTKEASPSGSGSDGDCVSMDETMSTCSSFKSPEVEYLDSNDVPEIDSIEKKTSRNLWLSNHLERAGIIFKRDAVAAMENNDKIVNIDNNYMDPQLCAYIASDIYKHLRASEVKKRPSIDFMEKIQKDITPNMRGILIDWLVEVAEEYRLVPETLYLTVNYVDRYLSGNSMNRQRLQLLGVACMMIAAKYEEICAPQVEEFCYITDNTYSREEVVETESAVLNFLNFEMTAPTVMCFLRRFTRAAQGIDEVPSIQLECMASYIAELSLLEYRMLHYAPSLVAASAVFLAKYVLYPSMRPWNSTLQYYTRYRPSDLSNCVKDLHHLCCNNRSSNLPAIREKYSQHKYKCVALKHCPPMIPLEFLSN